MRGAVKGTLSLAILVSAHVFVSPGTGAVSNYHVPPSGETGREFHLKAAYDPLVREIQQELSRQGYNPGPADGYFGGKTARAVADYQRDQGLPSTGRPSHRLLERLRQTGAVQRTHPDRDQRQATVERLQGNLRRLGYDVQVTGRLDRPTRVAIRAYQRDHDLAVTGRMSQDLSAHVIRERRQQRRARRRDRAHDVDRETIAAIQDGLRQRGYDVGGADGEMDARTRNAIEAYQRQRGVAVTGRPSDELAKMLREGMRPQRTSRATVRSVQRELNQRGYRAGPPDGVMGPATQRAVRRFKEREGLKPNRRITQALLRKLGIIQSPPDRDPIGPNLKERIRDNFRDGDYTRNPRWHVVAGEFSVRNGALYSNVQDRYSDEDIGKQFLEGVLGQVLGVNVPGGRTSAAIVRRVSLGNQFRVRIRIKGDPDDRARINLGPHIGNNISHGYRLVYDSAASCVLSLILVEQDGTRSLSCTDKTGRLANGKVHEIEWSRERRGRMTVKVDGKTVLTARDRTLTRGFDGFSFINAGGEWGIRRIVLHAAE